MEYVVETEKEIVQNYIIKSKQERIEWELSHSKKRKDIIWHFHKPDIFKEASLLLAPTAFPLYNLHQ